MGVPVQVSLEMNPCSRVNVGLADDTLSHQKIIPISMAKLQVHEIPESHFLRVFCESDVEPIVRGRC